ncbi:ribosome biosynthesis protein rrb1 [Agyrium rufum]|nr:ribosome biosynthesis protein rrb1 [Agyrium rufum]
MSKRSADYNGSRTAPLKRGERPDADDLSDGVGEYEDESEDEFESEEEIFEAGVDGGPNLERQDGEKRDKMDVDEKTFIVGRNKLQEGETLSPDTSTYEMLHTLSATWPCLSFDILRDSLGDNRKSYPATVFAVAGTQAEEKRSRENELMVMKLGSLSRMPKIRDSDDEDESSDDEEELKPDLQTRSIPLATTTNRIRSHQLLGDNASESESTLAAVMLENRTLQIYDITPHISSLSTSFASTPITPQQSKPLATITSHRSEGYALAWSPLFPQGKLLSGDHDGNIFLTTCTDGNRWTADDRPFTGHTSSVEDLQWSPNEKNVFGSASSDGTVKIWDIRSKSHKPAISVTVSETDVNVLSWSRQTPHLLATGADDGQWAVWDLRQWKPAIGTNQTSTDVPSPIASFDFHKEQITSVEWHPTDDSIVAVAAGDNTLTLWDLAVEQDDEESRDTAGVQDVPPQLLFVHYMELVKECHWHPQMPGVVMATGGNGFGVFKTISV